MSTLDTSGDHHGRRTLAWNSNTHVLWLWNLWKMLKGTFYMLYPSLWISSRGTLLLQVKGCICCISHSIQFDRNGSATTGKWFPTPCSLHFQVWHWIVCYLGSQPGTSQAHFEVPCLLKEYNNINSQLSWDWEVGLRRLRMNNLKPFNTAFTLTLHSFHFVTSKLWKLRLWWNH